MRLKTIPLFFTLLVLLTNCNNQDIFSQKRAIPPQVSYSFPDSVNSTGFKTNSSMLLSFDTNMDRESLSTDNIKLKNQSNEAIACSIETYGDRALIISPSTEGTFLSPETGYMLSISKNVKDSYGNGMKKDFLVNFKTGATHDGSRPRVIEELTRVENNIIKLYFNEPLNPKTVEESHNSSKIYLQDEDGEEVQCDFHYVAMDKTLLIEPFSELKPNISYGLTLASDSVKDLAGNYLGEEFTFNFTNGEVEEDTTAPEVSHIEQTVPIIIRFNEDIDPASLRLYGENPTIKLHDQYIPYSEDINYTIVYTDGSKKVMLINEEAQFGEGGRIFTGKVELTTGITDLAGNPLEESKFFYMGEYEVNSAEDYDYISGCNGISDNLYIRSDELTDLSKLESLNFVGGELVIDGCTNLTSIEALRNLKRVDGRIEISNSSLTTLEGLKNIKGLESITIRENHLLNDLSGLEDIEECQSIYIGENNNLKNLSGLSGLKKVYELNIRHNDQLESLSSLSRLEEISDLIINFNDSLQSLEGLENITALDYFMLTNNANLESTSGLDSLTCINSLNIKNNEALTSIELTALDTINYINIRENDQLVEINLPNLSEINNGYIVNNTSCETSLIDDLLNRVNSTENVTVSGNNNP